MRRLWCDMPMPTEIISHRVIILAVWFALTIALTSSSVSEFVSIFVNYLQRAPQIVAMALAAGVLISCGLIDLSAGAMYSLAGMIILLAVNVWPGTFLVPLIISASVIGLLYSLFGWCVSRLGLSALLCSLAIGFCAKSLSVVSATFIQGVWRPFGYGFENGSLLLSASEKFHWLSSFPLQVVGLTGIICILVWWRFVSFSGIRHIAVGMDCSAAARAGISVSQVYWRAIFISCSLVLFAAITDLYGASQGAWKPDSGWNKEMIAIAAAVLGGCRLTGGRFDPVTISVAAMVLSTFRDLADYLKVPPDLSLGIMGLAVLISAVLDTPSLSRNQSSPSLARGQSR